MPPTTTTRGSLHCCGHTINSAGVAGVPPATTSAVIRADAGPARSTRLAHQLRGLSPARMALPIDALRELGPRRTLFGADALPQLLVSKAREPLRDRTNRPYERKKQKPHRRTGPPQRAPGMTQRPTRHLHGRSLARLRPGTPPGALRSSRKAPSLFKVRIPEAAPRPRSFPICRSPRIFPTEG